jgi:hypothetical protein
MFVNDGCTEAVCDLMAQQQADVFTTKPEALHQCLAHFPVVDVFIK